MIKISCRTNIDIAKQLQWPTELPERPIIGDKIRSLSSTLHKHIELEVYDTCWVYGSLSREWYLEVELHLPKHRFENIQHFEKFVKRNDSHMSN